ncbi:uncharacterized protein I206_105442 [Kwoniella pini CBS 10737]|uniref:WW domain-containing protein n=1 Tax=Kwoniella pini CBS 10737 TaxID=1296096 RepID=A0A1B9I498_9TREE|nr:uncharacterized protein I206_03652 [Kwoniella pini CBS 10737]OCF50333.1 hypothetical protein I206_03652 [Kwoniella pini CBS 10737]
MASSTIKKATVEEAESSPSPPSSSSKLPEFSTNSQQEENVTDEPIKNLEKDKDDDSQEEEDEEEWDPSSEKLLGQINLKEKGKNKEIDNEIKKDEEEQPWQAVWAEQQNAWYFWNTKTGQVSWTNPLINLVESEIQPPLPPNQPPLPNQSSLPSTSTLNGIGITSNQVQNEFDINQGQYNLNEQPEIDEGLAYLFGGGGGTSSNLYGIDNSLQKASFNSRTGKFQSNQINNNPGYLDEYNRSKRMNNYYFDVEQWEKEKVKENELKRKRQEEQGNLPEKKITKKDIERFKKKNQERKQRSQAWLRE